MINYQLIVKILIDRRCGREVIIIKISIQSDKKDINLFLRELNGILETEEFDIEKNLIFIKKKKDREKVQFSTPYTMADLDYDTYDVVDRLKELTIKEYAETLFDKDDDKPPLLFVFGKDINERQVYIKLKIKQTGELEKKVLCLSFHYAEKAMTFPYA